MIYGTNLYGSGLYADDSILTDEDIHLYMPDLMKYLPEYYHRNSKITKEIQRVISIQLGKLYYTLEDFFKQLNISTATWGLNLYEEELGITTNTALSLEERREIIIAKIRGRGTTTVAMIKKVAESFSGGEVDIIEHNEEYYFTVKFVGTLGIPKNMKAFKEMLETIKPAHLAYELTYTFTTCQMLIDMNVLCKDAKLKTCTELKTYEEKEVI